MLGVLILLVAIYASLFLRLKYRERKEKKEVEKWQRSL